jgi:Tol biopolymer transport system component
MAGTRVATWLAVALLPALAVPTGLAGGQKADEAEVLLQAARHKELVAGEVESAIGIYRKILADHAGNRPVAARALVEMGRCYEKLGKDEAGKAYERVLRDYADQNEAATEARTRLAALHKPAGAGGPPELTTRRVWGGPGVDIEGSVSADGRHLSFVDWQNGGELAVRDLETGTNRRLTRTAGGELDWALDSRISPDGRQVAYTWYNSEGLFDLRLVALDGSGPRVLHTARAKEYVSPAAWSPDGGHVLEVVSRPGSPSRIGLVSVADGSVRVLKTLDSGGPKGVSFSPDGHHIAYGLAQQEGAANGDIFLLSIDGKRESALVQHPANDMHPVWAPDGTWILFASDRTGSLGLWGISVADGTPRGPAQPVKPDVGELFWPLGFSRDGRFHYGLQVGMTDVYVAPFDFQSGKLLAEPKKATERYVGSNTGPEWSPDGRYLAYVSSRGRSWRQGSLALCIRSLDTGEERDLTPDLGYYMGPRWSPDGRSLLLVGFDRQSRSGLYRVDVETGVVTPLVQSEVDVFPASLEWARGGKAVVYRRQQPNTTGQRIVVRDIESGREEEVYRAPAGTSLQGFALSPDGLQVAFRSYDEAARVAALNVVPTAGGAPRELLRAGKDEIPGGMPLGVWSPDGSQILFTRARTKGKLGLWRVPAQGGEAQEVGLTMESLREVRVHPDGRRIAFAAGSPAAPEVWVMENVRPPTAGPK